MDRLRTVQVFLAISRAGSFAAAARQLGMSKASVTKHVAALEGLLGARLLQRTTRSVALTSAGHAVAEHGDTLLQRFEQLEAEVRESVRSSRGAIRIGTPPAFGANHLVPIVIAFAARHPEIEIAITLDTGSANLVAEGLDLSIRIAPSLADASHVALPLAKAPQALVAAPGYLDAHGVPQALDDLARHNCLVHAVKSPTSLWRFRGPDGLASIRVRGTLRSNLGDAIRQAALLGHGIAMHPYYMVADDLAAGRLVAVLPDFTPEAYDIHVIYSSRDSLPLRVRRFLDFLRDWVRTPPPWAQASPNATATGREMTTRQRAGSGAAATRRKRPSLAASGR